MKKIPPEPAASLTDVFHTHVTLQHTDAVGVLFAASPITWAQLGFENLMRAAGHPLETVLWAETHYPIVKLTIEHQRKLTLGTEICVETYIERVGNRSRLLHPTHRRCSRPGRFRSTSRTMDA